ELLKRTKKEIEPTALIWCIIVTLVGSPFFLYMGTMPLVAQFQQDYLLSSGVKTEGIVIAKRVNPSPFTTLLWKSRFEITLKYTTLEEKEVEVIYARISREKFEEIGIGDTIPLLYDPKNPYVLTTHFSPLGGSAVALALICYPLSLLSVAAWLKRWLYVKNKLYLYEHGIESTGVVKRHSPYYDGLGVYHVLLTVENKDRKYRVKVYVPKKDFKHISVGRTIKILVDPKKPKKAIYLPDWFSRQAS
ncbi:DUF3592 domain-containing protein, partial [Thermodesulfovibrionales bacterium]|nr:DUF3592 domain-containing protein [Thermodesulfovibrionales bacterium]